MSECCKDCAIKFDCPYYELENLLECAYKTKDRDEKPEEPRGAKEEFEDSFNKLGKITTEIFKGKEKPDEPYKCDSLGHVGECKYCRKTITKIIEEVKKRYVSDD